MLLKERIKRLEVENRILNILKRGMEDLKKKGLFGQMSADIKRDLIEISRKEELNRKELSQISSIAVSTLADWEKGPEDNNHDKRGL